MVDERLNENSKCGNIVPRKIHEREIDPSEVRFPFFKVLQIIGLQNWSRILISTSAWICDTQSTSRSPMRFIATGIDTSAESGKSITAASLRRGMPFLIPSLIFLPLLPPRYRSFWWKSAGDSISRNTPRETTISPYVLYIRVYILVYFYRTSETSLNHTASVW